MTFLNNRKPVIFLAALFFLFFSVFLSPYFSKKAGLYFLAEKLEKIELKLLDMRLNILKANESSASIAMIAADVDSCRKIGRWPWRRSIHARLIDILKSSSAKLIVFDIYFSQPTERNEDDEFLKSVKKAGNVICVRGVYYDEFGELKLSPILNGMEEASQRAVGVIPYDLDRKIRRGYLFLDFDAGRYPALAFEVYRKYKNRPALLPKLFSDNSFLIYYSSRKFKNMPYWKVIAKEFPTDFFKDKIVIVYTTHDPHDYFLTPVKSGAKSSLYAGGQIHAEIINTLLSGKFIKRFSFMENIIIAAVLLLLGSFVLTNTNLFFGSFFIIFELILFYFINFQIFKTKLLWIDFASPSAVLILFLIFTAFYDWLRIKNIFAQFVPRQKAEALAVSSKDLALGGKKVNATILFCDIMGYTSLSEKIPPEELINLVNKFHKVAGEICTLHSGEVGDYQGDAQMLVFVKGSPVEQAVSAVRAAVEIKAGASSLKGDFEKFNWDFKIGIGIASGQVAYGLVGGRTFKQFAALGDPTNLASRLQALSKDHLGIILAKETYELVKDKFTAIPLENVKVKGKEKKLTVFLLET